MFRAAGGRCGAALGDVARTEPPMSARGADRPGLDLGGPPSPPISGPPFVQWPEQSRKWPKTTGATAEFARQEPRSKSSRGREETAGLVVEGCPLFRPIERTSGPIRKALALSVCRAARTISVP
jgi:hypothetical protein